MTTPGVTDTVTSADGTTIGYYSLGRGQGLVLRLAAAPGHMSHANAVGDKCLRQYEGRARGGRAKRPRIRQRQVWSRRLVVGETRSAVEPAPWWPPRRDRITERDVPFSFLSHR
jgi:hypothetical protein